MNDAMRKILQNIMPTKDNIHAIDNLCNEILSKIQKANDCIIYDKQNIIKEHHFDFNKQIKLLGDRTGLEMWYNEIRLDGLKTSNILQFLKTMKEKLNNKYVNTEFCLIIYLSEDNDIDFRFHTYRKEEGLWLNENLEKYNGPIIYDLSLAQANE
jgi:hypothetical protein